MSWLEVRGLSVRYGRGSRSLAAVREVSFQLEKGQTLGIVGESGCGKSTLALALIGLLPKEEGRVSGGTILFDGTDLSRLSEPGWQAVRGRRIAMVFQDPFSALNPVLSVRFQLEETLALDGNKNVADRARSLIERVQLSEPDRILNSYPHQLSGGQRQRVLIAIALARNPDLLIADEPTTALDVTVQDEIIRLLKSLQAELGMGLIFVTHNLGLVKSVADDLAVMYAGQFVETGPVKSVLSSPRHPYTQGLLRSLPSLHPAAGPLPTLEGQPPDPAALPSGCPFHPRCEKRFDPCAATDPVSRRQDRQRVRCHLYPEA